MKKIKLMALSMAASVMIMGAGYAYWTESLTVNNTVHTGTLSCKFTVPDDKLVTSQDMGGSNVWIANNKTLGVTLNNIYPGAEATVKFNVVNDGTLEAKLKDFDFNNFAGYTDAKEQISVEYVKINDIEIESSNTPITLANIDSALPGYSLGIGNMAAGETAKVEAKFKVKTSADKDNFGYGETLTFDIVSDVLQYNDDVN